MICIQVLVGPEEVSNIARIFKTLGYDIQVADVIWQPLQEAQHWLEPSSEEAKKISQIMDDLNAEDDVMGVFCNAISEEPI